MKRLNKTESPIFILLCFFFFFFFFFFKFLKTIFDYFNWNDPASILTKYISDRYWPNRNPESRVLAEMYLSSLNDSITFDHYILAVRGFLNLAQNKVDEPLTQFKHYKNTLFKYIENFTSKNWKNSPIKNSDIFHISTQNIDSGYSLEPPRRGGSNEYPHSMFLDRNKKNNVYPYNPPFYHIKVRFKGVNII